MNIDQAIEDRLGPASEAIASFVFYSVPVMGQEVKLILAWLVIAALFFTFYLGFINIRYFAHAIAILRGKYDKPGASGHINRFQALTTSLSGTVGLGNIAGVAVAVSVGGPGAVFWMAMMGLFGMTVKFAEVMLGVKYRHEKHLPDGRVKISGGPMYYLRDAFNNRDIPYIGNIMGAFFAVCVLFGAIGAGSLFQTNQTYQQLLTISGGQESFFADKGWLVGLCMAVLVGIVIIGGIKSIAAVASKIVPVMGIVYLLAGFVVIAMNYQQIPESLLIIVKEALVPEAGLGALFGALLMGVQRASFSNEAGLGSAAIAHSSVKTDQPVSQGFVGMLGPFIDTIIICMVTAFVIVISGAYMDKDGMEGVELTSRAFASSISWFPYVLAFTVFLFAYSTLISWSYYGVKGATFLFGEHSAVEIGYKLFYCLAVIVGASANLGSVINITDSLVFAMAVPNIIGLYLLAPEIKSDIRKYFQDIENK
ncbi:MAG: alanine:cation symporter family protein [Rhodospirillales bacterium]|nr:alanine:cation symporter family protein [Rhodospirillales bacterium]